MRSYKQFHSKQLLDLVFAEKPAAPALVAVDGAAEFSELGGDWAVAGFLLWKREGICICWNKTRPKRLTSNRGLCYIYLETTEEVSSVQKEKSPCTRVKRYYRKPRVASERMFETTALACGKCVSGPFSQFQCNAVPLAS
jgi:hypothetical protein